MKIQTLKFIDRILVSGVLRILPLPKLKSQATSSPKAVLVIRPGGIGDAVLFLPMLQRLRKSWPDAVLTVLAERRNAGVFALGGLDLKVLRYDVPRELLFVLRGCYDVVIDSEQWYRMSALVARLVRAPLKIGFATNERVRLFTATVSYRQDVYERDSFQQLLTPLGIKEETGGEVPFLKVPESACKVCVEVAERYPSGYVVLFPGASIPERRWSVSSFHDLGKRLVQEGLGVVVVGGQGEVDAGAEIVSNWGINLAGKTSLTETAAVLERASLLVSGDSGVLHIAVGLGVKTVSLFGPGIESKWGPQGEKHRIVNRHFPCSPCTRWGRTPTCRDKGRCISEITVDEVLAAAMQLLQP